MAAAAELSSGCAWLGHDAVAADLLLCVPAVHPWFVLGDRACSAGVSAAPACCVHAMHCMHRARPLTIPAPLAHAGCATRRSVEQAGSGERLQAAASHCCSPCTPACPADGFPVLEGNAEEVVGKNFEIRKVRRRAALTPHFFCALPRGSACCEDASPGRPPPPPPPFWH